MGWSHPLGASSISPGLRKMKFPSGLFFQPAAALLIPGRVFWPYFAGAAILIIGLARIIKGELRQTRGIDRAIAFGPLFLAIPMAVFGADHFMTPKFVATLVPSWIPAHLFWVYFVGTALIAAALSMVTGKLSALAAALLSAMLLCFVLLMHVPHLAAHPHNRILFAVLLRDSSFSGGALACALALAQESTKSRLHWMTAIVRYVIAVSTAVFGVEHFLFPEFVPVVPLELPMPSWIPGHLFLAYVTGAVLLASGLAIAFNWKARLAATWMGIVVFVIVMLVYLPIMIANVSDIDNGLNYLVDTLGFSGSVLLLAGILPGREHANARVVSGDSAARAAVS